MSQERGGDARFAPLFARWAARVRRRLALRHALTGAAIGLAVATAFLTANPVTAVVSVTGAPPVTKDIPLLYADKGYELGFYFVAISAAVALVGAFIMKHGRTAATGGAAH